MYSIKLFFCLNNIPDKICYYTPYGKLTDFKHFTPDGVDDTDEYLEMQKSKKTSLTSTRHKPREILFLRSIFE